MVIKLATKSLMGTHIETSIKYTTNLSQLHQHSTHKTTHGRLSRGLSTLTAYTIALTGSAAFGYPCGSGSETELAAELCRVEHKRTPPPIYQYQYGTVTVQSQSQSQLLLQSVPVPEILCTLKPYRLSFYATLTQTIKFPQLAHSVEGNARIPTQGEQVPGRNVAEFIPERGRRTQNPRYCQHHHHYRNQNKCEM